MTKIKKILIANRGEIACRVMETARKLGIQSVAVYSDADAGAKHVRAADEAVNIGPAAANESYLVVDKIIEACKQTDADAVHPGYGFLSENPGFARRLKKEGIIFIGPSAESMEAMGLKDAAKTLMSAAGVPVTPGYLGENQNPDHLKSKADKIGYPVLIKAVAGGGGKGMRKVEHQDAFLNDLASCRREAKASFGEDRVLLEKFITNPRHIEVQVFGDSHGNVVHMFERDCSLQRRHQKVIEEAPAPGMSGKVRAAMTKAAVKAAAAVDYVGAGTVEFIVDGSGQLREDGFWFMEMNTRLQVEHPVSEMITGLDFVELQIRIAEGEALPPQTNITMAGHAIEARLYAEDPSSGFLPSTGRLDLLDLDSFDVRRDSAVEQGDQVSVFYDPMIAKLIAHGATRESAIEKLTQACSSIKIYPVKSNGRFLYNCLVHPAFRSGSLATSFIAEHNSDLIPDNPLENDLSQIAKGIALSTNKKCKGPFESTDGWRPNLPSQTTMIRYIEGTEVSLPVHTAHRSDAIDHPDGQLVSVRGETYLVESGPAADVFGGSANAITAPMPGKIIAVNVGVGDPVKKGDKLLVMEAMKMEMALDAPRDGIIETIHADVGTLVSDDDILISLEEE